ncbi:MAG TPA: hypothetical protein VN017_09195 [Pseudoxanthomonas sp.]|nr:hypothetical protein [Pseudoxanthomonas sp.]
MNKEDSNSILRCYPHGVGPGDFCRASMLNLIADRGIFDDRLVVVPGYIGAVEGDYYMFPTREFYASRDFSSSVRLMGKDKLQDLNDNNQSNAVIFGRFSLSYPDPSTLLKPVGSIEVIHIRKGYNRENNQH